MNDSEMSDLENHLIRKIGAVIGDVVQLVDDPKNQAMVVSTAVVVVFQAVVETIKEVYETDTGGKANADAIILMLAKECVTRTQKNLSPRRKKAK